MKKYSNHYHISIIPPLHLRRLLLFLALFLGLFSLKINAQNTHLALSQLQACPGDELVFSLMVENLNNAAAISLFIGYDSTVLTYNGHTNVHPQFGGLLTNAMSTPQTRVGIFWTNMAGASLLSGVLVDLQFTYHGGNISLPFLSGCEIVDVNVNPISFSTSDGAVSALPPYIIEQPQNSSVTEGANALFTVLADQATAYQWYEKQGNSWLALQNDATYNNVQSAALTINAVSPAMDGRYYACEVSAAGACTVFSDSASLSVLEPGTVLLSLANQQLCPQQAFSVPLQTSAINGLTAFEINIAYDPAVVSFDQITQVNPLITNLSVEVVTTPINHLALSWSGTNGINIAEGQLLVINFENLLATTSLQFMDDTEILGPGQVPFNLVFQDAALELWPTPQITSQPANQSAYPNESVSFSIQASAVTAYQWYEKSSASANWQALNEGDNYAGVNSSTLQINLIGEEYDGYAYKCELIGTHCSVYSASALLTVLPTPQATLSVQQLMACPQSAIAVPVAATGITELKAFEISIGFNPDAMIFSGLQNLNPQLASATAEVFATPEPHIKISWSAPNPIILSEENLFELGFDYDAAAQNFNILAQSQMWMSETVAYELSFINGSVAPHPVPVIQSQPQSQSVSETGTASFSLIASGVQTYQWFESQDGGQSYNLLIATGPYSGVNSAVLQISPVTIAMDEYRYRCLLSGAFCEVYSAVAQLNVVPQLEAVLSLENALACHNDQATVALDGVGLNQLASFSIGVTYDTNRLQFEGVVNIASAFAGLSFSIETAPEPHVLINWSSQQAVSFGDGKLFDMLFEYSDGTTALDFMSFTELINSDQAVFDLTVVSGSVAAHEYPEIVMQPENQVVADGMDAVFSIQAEAVQSYQWELSTDGGINWTILQNDALYSGVQSADLTISNANSTMDQYAFRCNIVGNYCGLYTDIAVLTVLPEMTASLTVPNLMSCEFAAVEVPLKAAGLQDIKSLSLQISYNAGLLNYIGYEIVAEGLESAVVVNHTSADAYIEISWVSAQPVSIPNGRLFNFFFDYSTGFASFELSAAEVIGQEDLPYNLILNDGQLSAYASPQIFAQPNDTLVEEGTSAQFKVEAEQTLTYQWYESRDAGNTWFQIYDLGIYQGAKTNTLLINNVPYSYNLYSYKCLLRSQFCSLSSVAALLEVDPLINVNQSLNEQTSSHVKAVHLGASNIKIWFDDNVEHINELMIYDIYGNLLFDQKERLLISGNQIQLHLPFTNNSFLIVRIQTTSNMGVVQNQVFKSILTK